MLDEVTEPKSKSRKTSDKQAKVKLSNNMKDSVKTICQICSNQISFVGMRSHTKSAHNMGITDYKLQHGELIENIVEEIYHKCGICSEKILFHGDAIAPHAKKHKISHKDYNNRFITLRKKTNPPQVVKEELKTSCANMTSEELLAELDDLIASL